MAISSKQTFVVDVDGTICSIKEPEESYSDVAANQYIVDIINKLHYNGYHIILHTARGMRTYDGDIDNINKFVKPELEAWLAKHKINYHELIMGKPWGPNVTYIDDRAFRPDEFIFLNSKILPYLKDPE